MQMAEEDQAFSWTQPLATGARRLVGEAQPYAAEAKSALGAAYDELVQLFSLLLAWCEGSFAVPFTTVLAFVCTILYVLSPIDLIPDPIPLLGFLDDAALLGYVTWGAAMLLDSWKMVTLCRERQRTIEQLKELQVSTDEQRRQLEELVKEREQWEAQRECVVCMEGDRSVLFKPCLHVVACATCASALTKCPICRSTITKQTAVHMS